ncbi:hypothetical protein GCM10010465_04380 [Actinomadura fibrosa]
MKFSSKPDNKIKIRTPRLSKIPEMPVNEPCEMRVRIKNPVMYKATNMKLMGFDLPKKLATIMVFYIFVVLNILTMKDFFEGIQSFFEDFAFEPLNYLRTLELDSWWAANIVNWLFMIVGFAAFLYWMKQLKDINDRNEENRDSTAHSFLG